MTVEISNMVGSLVQKKKTSNILSLSNEVLLQIFMYLDPQSLLAAAQVCKSWNQLTEDNLFWQKKLELMRSTQHNFCSCGIHHELGQTGALNKRSYFKKLMVESNGICQSCGQKPKADNGIPKVLLFGPGLDFSGSSLVYDLMWGAGSPFKTLGMFPNSHEGLGGGVRLEYKGNEINLVTLYRATKKERETFQNLMNAQGRTNRIIDSEFMLEKSKKVCAASDAVIYVCDKTVSVIEEIRREFEVLINEISPDAPILMVMPETLEEGEQTTCADYVDGLNLTQLNRRWWMTTLNCKDLSQFQTGLDWLLGYHKPAVNNQNDIETPLIAISGGIASAFANFTSSLSSFF